MDDRLRWMREATLPATIPTMTRATAGAAGYDLAAAINPATADGGWTVPARGSAVIATGVRLALPAGTFGRVVLRSGHGFKRDLACHVGTIDRDYRGEVAVKVFNHGDLPQPIAAGERFAQLIVQPCLAPATAEVADLDATARGDGGFGSTGSC